MSSSSKFTLARLFSIESSELIHKLSKDFSEDPTAAIFGAQSCHQKIDREKVWGLLPVFRITIDITRIKILICLLFWEELRAVQRWPLHQLKPVSGGKTNSSFLVYPQKNLLFICKMYQKREVSPNHTTLTD